VPTSARDGLSAPTRLVIPAKDGIHCFIASITKGSPGLTIGALDPGFRRDDDLHVSHFAKTFSLR
jgi:hypothetical protein